MPTAVKFYHVLGRNYEKSLFQMARAQGERECKTMIITPNMRARNEFLWQFDAQSFIAHGLVDDKFSERMPIIIAPNDQLNPNNADNIIICDGAEIPQNIAQYKMVAYIFIDEDDKQKEYARGQWVALKQNEKLQLSYYKQDKNGTWVKN